MLTRLHVQGYKALRDIDTSLEPLTVIVGPNGCGKTSVLESIALVRDYTTQRDAGRVEHPIEELLTKNGEKSLEIEVDLGVRLETVDHEGPQGEPADGNQAQEIRITLVHKQALSGISFDWEGRPKRRNPQEYSDPRVKHAREHLCSTRSLALDVKALARPSYLRDVAPRIEDDGSGLATVLSTLIGEHREKFDEIQGQLREFVPEVERIFLRPAPISVVESRDVSVGLDKDGNDVWIARPYQRDVVGHEILFDYRNAKAVRAKHASEGTLLLLGLLTVVVTGDASILLLDDIDRALHPKAQQQLVGYLRKLAERGVQVIATTHSPYLVLHLEYEEVRAMTMSDSGGALIGKLTEHPEYERWREDMTPSEFWTVFGEEWLAKAKTKAEGHG